MRLTELMPQGALSVTGSTDIDILGVAHDSRLVRPGWLFAALPGETQDGRAFINDAIRRGATAVAVQPPFDPDRESHATYVLTRDTREFLAAAACAFHRNPSDRLQMVGITGTNGKTTTAFIVRDILRGAGRLPGVVGTVSYEIGERTIPAARTTPEAPELQSILAEMVAVGCKSAVMEVSSHALVQKRVWHTQFDVAVFTNLSRDHLDYHGNFEKYFEAKCRLFENTGVRRKDTVNAINIDDAWGQELAARDLRGEVITFGTNARADVLAEQVSPVERGSSFALHSPWGDTEMRVNLMGSFNVSNVLAATAACGVLGVEPDCIAEAVSGCRSIPGRLEEIESRKGPRVFVDYAHTDDALKNVLQALRESNPERIILVFGCGGNRDSSKRPAMGEVACRFADHSIITTDNSRKEDPMAIIDQIRHGFNGTGSFEVEPDRAAAIHRALDLAGKGDIILVAGKGHETFQELENTVVPFDDREVVRDMMKNR